MLCTVFICLVAASASGGAFVSSSYGSGSSGVAFLPAGAVTATSAVRDTLFAPFDSEARATAVVEAREVRKGLGLGLPDAQEDRLVDLDSPASQVSIRFLNGDNPEAVFVKYTDNGVLKQIHINAKSDPTASYAVDPTKEITIQSEAHYYPVCTVAPGTLKEDDDAVSTAVTWGNVPCKVSRPSPSPAPSPSPSQRPSCGYVCNSANDEPAGGQCSVIEGALGAAYPTMDYSGPCFLNLFDGLDNNFGADVSKCDEFSGLLLFDEPYTQADRYPSKLAKWGNMGHIVDQWKQFAQKNSAIIMQKRAAGMKVTAPQFSSYKGGPVQQKLTNFFATCGEACSDENSPAKIDVIAFNAYLDIKHPLAGQVQWAQDTAAVYKSSFGKEVWVTNYGMLNQPGQTRDVTPQDEATVISTIPEISAASRVYYFSAVDVCGRSPPFSSPANPPCVPISVNSLTNPTVKAAFLQYAHPFH